MQERINKSPIWFPADWPAPVNIHAGTTTRVGGFSISPYSSLNLAGHVDDDPDNVSRNRQKVIYELNLPGEPVWLTQVHGNNVINISTGEITQQADGAYTNTSGHVCVVLTADCLPLLICDQGGKEAAAIHIGWRGYSKDIVSSALKMFTAKPEKLMAWIGPYIHSEYYEVGEEVRSACLNIAVDAAQTFQPAREGHWYANLDLLVRYQLEFLGLTNIYGGKYCTYRDANLFYSYRRDGNTGRVASMIWMDSF